LLLFGVDLKTSGQLSATACGLC